MFTLLKVKSLLSVDICNHKWITFAGGYKTIDTLCKLYHLSLSYIYTTRGVWEAIHNMHLIYTISKDIYDNTLILEGSTCSYKRDNFLDLYIRVIDDKFVTGIYHKVDDFNFEVISYPFPDSNIHSSLGYSTFYSQLIRFHRLCNYKSDFLFRDKLIYQKLINRCYKFNLLRKYFMRLINKYPLEIKYEIQRHGNVFLQMLYFDNYVVCNINGDGANKIVAPCFVKIEIAKPPFTNRINQSWPFPKNLEHAHKVRWCHPFPNRLAERKWG